MILVAGLSPAWQQIAQLPHLRVGEVNRARSVQWCASGKVLNVGLALHRLRGLAEDSPEVQVLSVAGGPAGDELRAQCARWGVPVEWIATRAPTRVCTTLLDQQTGRTTEIVENAGPIEPEELAAFEAAFRERVRDARVVVLAGSFPAGTPVDFYARLARHTTAPLVVDAQGAPLLATLAARPAVIKPNREELGNTLGRAIDTHEHLIAALAECQARGAQGVVITQGAEPVMVSSGNATSWLRPPTVPVVNPIGSGDCLAAGLAWGLARGLSLLESAQWGVAAAADNVSQLGPADLSAPRVRGLFSQVRVEPGSP
jgi:1-phosphofructokinase family hexose kinase